MKCGNPVDPLSYSKEETQIDFSTGGSKPLTFVRHYGRPGGGIWPGGDVARLGQGWFSNYDAVLQFDGSTAFARLPEGPDMIFVASGGGWVPGYMYNSFIVGINPNRIGAVERLEVAGGHYLLHDKNDTIWDFDSTGRLAEIRERGGYVKTLSYDGNGNNTLVTDSFGRQLTMSYDASDRLATLEVPGGDTYTFSYVDKPSFTGLTPPQDGWGALLRQWGVLTTVTRPDGEVRTYHYEDTDHRFALTGITDERGVRYATYAYNPAGRPISTEHFGGTDAFSFAYDDANTRVTVTNPLGKETIFDYTDGTNANRRLTEVIGQPSPNCPLSNSTFEYDANAFLSATVDAEGRRTESTNDGRGLPTEIVRAVGTADEQTTNYAWHADFRVPTQIEAPGLTTDIDYDADGNTTEVTQTDTTTVTVPYVTAGTTRTWAYTYATGGLVETIDGPLAGTGDTITYDYDADGFLQQVTNQLGQITDIVSVNDRGLPTEIEDPNGLQYGLGYDDIGRLTSFTEDAAGTPRVTDIDYDEVGEVTKITLPDGSFLDYVYSGARRLESVENNAGERIEYAYDLAGNMTNRVVKSAASSVVETQSRTFDELGRLLTLIGASSQTWTFSYDKVNNLRGVEDPRFNDFVGAYDALNRLIALTDEDDSTTTLTRAETGEVATLEDPNSVTTTYVRNGWGEAIREQSPDVGTTDYVRNALGLVSQKTDARGIVSTYSYDALGRMTGANYPTSAENVGYVYDATAGGNLGIGALTSMSDESGSTAFTYDARPGVAKVTTTIGGKTYTVGYKYDAAGRVTEISYPDKRLVSYAYDASGRPTTIATRDVFNGRPFVNLATGIAVQPFDGTWIALSHANGVDDSRVLDDDVRITSYATEDGATDLVSRTLAYGDGINLTSVTDTLNAANNETYGYTPSNRLEDTAGPWGSLDLITDGVGNRSSQVLTAGMSTTTDVYALASGTNRISSVTTNGTPSRAFTHDAAGSILTDTKGGVTTTFAYNNAGRMASLTVGSIGQGPYRYNGFAQLASRTVTANPTRTLHMVYDQDGNLIVEADGVTGEMLREYIWMQGRPVAVIDAAADSTVYAVHVNHLDRPVMMTDSGAIVWQADYLPFGEVRTSSGPASLNYRLPGQWFMLETGLHYNWHRWYDATTGRYTQPDPIGMPDGPSRYAYALNTPLMRTDPDGRGWLGDWLFGEPARPACRAPDPGEDDCDLVNDVGLPDIGHHVCWYQCPDGTLIQVEQEMRVPCEESFSRKPIPGIFPFPGM